MSLESDQPVKLSDLSGSSWKNRSIPPAALRSNKQKSIEADSPKLEQLKAQFYSLPLRDQIVAISTDILLSRFSTPAFCYHVNSILSNPLTLMYQVANVIIVLLSIVEYIVQSNPQYQTQNDWPQFLTIEVIVIAWFTFDYCLKFTLTRELRSALSFLSSIRLTPQGLHSSSNHTH